MRKLVIIVGCLLYVIWPIDLIPDFAPIIGWLDDAGALAVAVATALNKTEKSGTA